MCPSILYFRLQVQLQMSMPSCCNRMRYAKTRITMLITALHSGQLSPSSATRRAQFSQNLACPVAQRQSLPSVPTDILRNTVITAVSVSSLLYSPPSLTETTCLLLTYVLNLGVNAVDHTVLSNNTGLTLNAYVCSCSTPSFSSPANSAIPSITTRRNFTNFYIHVICGRGLVPL